MLRYLQSLMNSPVTFWGNSRNNGWSEGRVDLSEYMNVTGGDMRVYLGIVSVGMPLTTGGDEPYFKAMLCVLRPDSFRVME